MPTPTRKMTPTATNKPMKRVFALIAVLLICTVFAMSAAAIPAQAAGESAGVTSADGQQDVIVEEEDMAINLTLTTTLIITICSVLTVCVIVTAVILARRNRAKA